ncbi:hypothetical protein CBS101457_000959 [Exobasidium rhododendri]|nr:hypothetical protein CBS101457_000959 [Exobasidium rhododendri]
MSSPDEGHHTMEVDNDWLNLFLWSSYPYVFAQSIVLLELIRILPAEIRMWMRAIKRRRPNAAEAMFFAIKYFAIIGFVGSAVVRQTKLPKDVWQCSAPDRVGFIFTYLSTSVVAAAIAWRCYIIFQCSRKVYWMLIAVLTVQVSLSMWAAVSQLVTNTLTDGWCDLDYSPELLNPPVYKRASPYYLIYNVIFDLTVSAISAYHLVRNSGAAFGLSQVSRVLFYNNIHYVMIVCTTNLVEFIVMYAFPKIPSLMPISLAIQIITGMNIVAIEQDLVHRPVRSQISHAPLKGERIGRSGSSSAGRHGMNPDTSITSTTGNWQTNTKDICTFQTESSVGSPILHSIWTKHARKFSSSHSRSKSSNTVNTAALSTNTPTAGITYEQKKMHFYDDDDVIVVAATDMEKQEYPRSDTLAWTTPRKVDYTADNDAGDSLRRKQMPFSAESPTKSPHAVMYHNATKKPSSLPSPSPSLKRDNSFTSSKIHSATGNPFHEGNTSPAAKKASEGISIRSIRANMETGHSFDQLDHTAGVPFKTAQSPSRPQTSPKTCKSLKVSTTRAHNPTFEISAGEPVLPPPTVCKSPADDTYNMISPYPFTTSHQQSPPTEHTILHQMSKTSLQSAYFSSMTNDDSRTESNQSHHEKTSPRRPMHPPPFSPSKSQASCYPYTVNASPSSPPRRRRNNSATNTVLEIGYEYEDDLDQFDMINASKSVASHLQQ